MLAGLFCHLDLRLLSVKVGLKVCCGVAIEVTEAFMHDLVDYAAADGFIYCTELLRLLDHVLFFALERVVIEIDRADNLLNLAGSVASLRCHRNLLGSHIRRHRLGLD